MPSINTNLWLKISRLRAKLQVSTSYHETNDLQKSFVILLYKRIDHLTEFIAKQYYHIVHTISTINLTLFINAELHIAEKHDEIEV